jgi:hypothetical protein
MTIFMHGLVPIPYSFLALQLHVYKFDCLYSPLLPDKFVAQSQSVDQYSERHPQPNSHKTTVVLRERFVSYRVLWRGEWDEFPPVPERPAGVNLPRGDFIGDEGG